MELVISSFRCLFLLCVCLVLDLVLKVSGNAEGDALSVLKNNLIDPSNALHSWDSTLVNPCTWFHVSCNNDNSVIRVDLGNANLSGQLVPQLGQLPNLQYLELYNNKITGEIPEELGSLTNLVSLDLYMNNLTGPIPNEFANLKTLRFLRLNNNSLSGKIPMGLTNVSLQVLDLSYNNLSGNVPDNGSFSIFTPISFDKNPFLNSTTPNSPAATPQQNPSGKGNGYILVIAGGVALGAALLFAAPVIALVYWNRRKQQEPDDYFDVAADEDTQDENPRVNLSQLKKFSLRELQVATDNFDDKNIIGRGGFGRVYKGRLTNGDLVAVKKLKDERIRSEGKEFQTELEIISLAVHRNLLRLRGFCMTPTDRLLVYPLMDNGSLDSCLQERSKSKPPLEWPVRKRIALGAARGLAYLHDHCNPKIIHRDVKAANILLDKDFEAVVGDFGLAKLMDYKNTHVTTAVRGTLGHIAPEYLSTGKSSDKTDVFGYGVMLLELVTGQRAFDLARLASHDEVMLFEWVKTLMKDKKLKELVDQDLQGNYDEKEVEEVIQLALLCTQSSSWERPTMSEVERMLDGEGLEEKWDQWWKREDTIQQNLKPFKIPTAYDSTSNIEPEQLSGPR
ncbi:hypothetical protein VNO78_11495 [Psophocarpus tetragonolobus]|uniref:non-specific serine/threonine protein kinase n=1 Tax=Psophocarpus tetragonolobus TaxID=3891 RepID=A0AAN9SMF4_PSOTE